MKNLIYHKKILAEDWLGGRIDRDESINKDTLDEELQILANNYIDEAMEDRMLLGINVYEFLKKERNEYCTGT